MVKRRRPNVRQVQIKVTTEWMSTEEAAQYLRVASARALYELVATVAIPAYRVGKKKLLFSKTELDAYIRSRKYEPSAAQLKRKRKTKPS